MPARRFALLPLLLALAGCAAPRPAPLEPEPPGVVACRAEARREAASRDLFRQHNPAMPANRERLDQERLEAEAVAFRDCLRREGISFGGGVERVRQR